MTTLFNLTDAYQQVYDLIAEQGDETVLIETLQSINDALEEKADGYVAVIKTLEADNVAIDEEIKRLRQRKTSNQRRIIDTERILGIASTEIKQKRLAQRHQEWC